MKFSEIKKKLSRVGFDDFYQSGSISRFHPMNIVAKSRALNLQFWICVDGGYRASEAYHISERPLDNCNAPTKRANFRTQAEVVAGLERILLRIEEAPEKAAEFNRTSTPADFEYRAEEKDCN